MEPKRIGWRDNLTEREQKEVDFAKEYTWKFNHGTDGHNRLILINRMAEMLDAATDTILTLSEAIGEDEKPVKGKRGKK